VSERGNAPAEFVLVSALLAAVVLGVMQIILVGYVRHTITSAAAEGARQAALVDVGASEAISLTKDLIATSLSLEHARQVSLARSMERGYPTAVITVVTPFPALGLWSIGGTMTVSAHAPVEYAK